MSCDPFIDLHPVQTIRQTSERALLQAVMARPYTRRHQRCAKTRLGLRLSPQAAGGRGIVHSLLSAGATPRCLQLCELKPASRGSTT